MSIVLVQNMTPTVNISPHLLFLRLNPLVMFDPWKEILLLGIEPVVALMKVHLRCDLDHSTIYGVLPLKALALMIKSDQCDQMAKLFIPCLAICKNTNLPKSKIKLKFC